MTAELQVFCRTATAGEQRDAVFVEIDGKARRLTLRISQLSKQIAQSVDPILTDLLEVAGYVYATDTVVSRGGLTQRRMGEDWRRKFHLSIPVRELDIWTREDIKAALEDVLSFVSEDNWRFTFRQAELAPEPKEYLNLAETEETAPTSVMLFSGGLDSFAGALDEVLSRGERVALVTHGSGTKLAPIQKKLVAYLRQQTSAPSVQHIPVTAQVRAGETKEETHRSRSFLFAALGVATARCFGLDRIHFFENGVVSMNLPLGSHVVGARATRSTHPQTLAGFSKFFTALLGSPMSVDNPFFWKTKAEVIDVLRQHEAQGMIRHTFSCAHVREITRQHTHCGRCSQCVDRRLSMLAAGLAHEDPVVDYKTDLLAEPITDTQDRELALAYVRAARRYRELDERSFLVNFPEVTRAMDALGQDRKAGLQRLLALHNRHGTGISEIVDGMLADRLAPKGTATLEDDTLLTLIGQERFAPRQPLLMDTHEQVPVVHSKPDLIVVKLIDAPRGTRVEIEGLGDFTGAAAEVLMTLAEQFLAARGGGLAPEDHPLMKGGKLAEAWDLESEEGVRKRIQSVRSLIAKRAKSAGQSPPDPKAIVENLPWHGYRLNPTNCDVRRIHD
ncbi:MAG: 7-cyano-7-deazaguanine synthase [Pseudomonadota bacterium]